MSIIKLYGFRVSGITLNEKFNGLKGFIRKLIYRITKRRLERALALKVSWGKQSFNVDLSLLNEDGTFELDPPLLIPSSFKKDEVKIVAIIPEDSDIAPGKVEFLYEEIFP